MESASVEGTKVVITCDGLQALIHDLVDQGYQVLGPTVRDGAIVYDAVAHLHDLPAGWTDRQDAGRYHLERREDGALFGFAVGPQSWKQFLHPPVETLLTARNGDDGVTVTNERTKPPNSHSSACGPARSTPSASRIRFFAKGRIRMRLTSCGAAMHLSLLSIVVRPEALASAFQCRLGQRSTRASIWP